MRTPDRLTVASETSLGTALVTGAGRGLGRHIAVALGHAGYRVGITSRSAGPLAETASLIRQSGAEVLAKCGDVTKSKNVTEVVKTVTEQLGPVRLLVNNAGYIGHYASFVTSSPEDERLVLETNLFGAMACTREVLPTMLERGKGYIVNVNSLRGSRPGRTSIAYSVSKAALMRFTDALAIDLDGTGVIAFDLSPGLVRTEMTLGQKQLRSIPAESWSPPERAAEQVVALASGRYDALHGRFVRAEDDLNELRKQVSKDPDRRRLRLVPAHPADGI